ncbi:MAG: MmcQ/YjbR family DNA-binding protein [Chloroflexi bacterium]|nr:MmcQ/YjbR family DNA-binding protein [Chloroflexota bacterium]
MARRAGLAWDDVRAVMAGFPGTVEGASYGTPAFRAGKKFLSRLREEGVLLITPLDDIKKQFLLKTQPDVYFETDHYCGGSAIITRLATKRMLARREASYPAAPGVSR